MGNAEMELVRYTITGAQDWPMFKFTFAIIGGVFLFCWGIITVLIGLLWYDLKKRIASQRSEDRKHCDDCKVSQNREGDALWKEVGFLRHNLTRCCAKVGVDAEPEPDPA